MPGKKTLALFIGTFAATLLATAPASLLGAWVSSVTHGTIELSSPRGTVWHGAATPVFHARSGKSVPFEQIDWEVSFLALTRGKIGLAFRQGHTAGLHGAEVDAGMTSIDLRHVSLAMPAEVLEEIHPLLQALHPQGQLEIAADHLVMSGTSLQGSASASWLGAGSVFSSVNPFGSYRLSLNGTPAQVAIVLTTLSGPLLLDGQGAWSVASGLTMEAHATTSSENREALAELLHHLGPEISPGTRLLKIGGAI